MRLLFISVSFLVLSCGTKTDSQVGTKVTDDTIDFQVKADSTAEKINEFKFGDLRIEEIKKGKKDSDYWETGLKEVKYRIFEGDSLLTTIEIRREDFIGLFNQDFGKSARIWDSGIFHVDIEHKKVIIISTFGQPESDNGTTIICISDFQGNKSFMDSPPDCSSGTNISFGKIVNCNGVYDYSKPLHEFNSCCTVFSDLINSRTLFYVVDWEGKRKELINNAFFIDIITKDTLESFVFTDFTYTLGYSALIEKNEGMGILSVLNAQMKELVTWDTLLNKTTFDLKRIKTADNLSPGLNTIKMYNETMEDVLIEFDDKHHPIKWNK